MPEMKVQCPTCRGDGVKRQHSCRIGVDQTAVPCTKCLGGKVTVEAGCDECGQSGWRVAGHGWSYETNRFEPIHRRCNCVTQALRDLGFYRHRRKKSA